MALDPKELAEANADLEDENTRLRALLREVEWTATRQPQYGQPAASCPICGGLRDVQHVRRDGDIGVILSGHRPNCRLAAELTLTALR